MEDTELVAVPGVNHDTIKIVRVKKGYCGGLGYLPGWEFLLGGRMQFTLVPGRGTARENLTEPIPDDVRVKLTEAAVEWSTITHPMDEVRSKIIEAVDGMCTRASELYEFQNTPDGYELTLGRSGPPDREFVTAQLERLSDHIARLKSDHDEA